MLSDIEIAQRAKMLPITEVASRLDIPADALDHYYLYHATRGELLRALGHPIQARAADQRALELTTNPAEQAILRRRIEWDPLECERPSRPNPVSVGAPRR